MIELKKRADAAIDSSSIALQGFALNIPKRAAKFPLQVTNFLASLFEEGERDSSCKLTPAEAVERLREKFAQEDGGWLTETQVRKGDKLAL